MPRYLDAIDLPVPIEQAFDYLADFSRVAEWDPGVSAARRLTRGSIGLGSRFRVDVAFLGRRIPLEYRISEFERPSRLVLTGGDASIRSVDEITFVSRQGGTRVTYDARVELAGLHRVVEPILALFFQRIGRVAMRGLRERVATAGVARRGSKRARSVRKQRRNQQEGGLAS